MHELVRQFRDSRLLADQKAVVVGAGSSGLAAARLLVLLGATVTLADKSEDLPADLVADLGENVRLELGPHTPQQFADADIVVMSPGVPVKKLANVLVGVPERKIIAEMELASWFTDEPILAVTGTNGKTTTVTLMSHILKSAGKTVFTGGNIGTPLCEHLLDGSEADVLVLEVSSFQLQNVRLFRPNVGVLMNFSANHLDYHEDMEEYLTAKLNLFAQQTEDDLAVLPECMRDELSTRDFTRAPKQWFTAAPTGSERFPAPHLHGDHNRSNIEAAWLAVREFGVTEGQMREAVANFQPLAHRLEPVTEINGVLFVDDSKATNLDAVQAALRSFDRPVRLLLGGVFKGGEVRDLLPDMRDRVVQIGLFGASREVFEKALCGEFDCFHEPTLEGAVRRLHAASAPGDVILLSPATASFDLYESYAKRGDDFRRVAKELA